MFDKTIKIKINGVTMTMGNAEIRQCVLDSIEYRNDKRQWKNNSSELDTARQDNTALQSRLVTANAQLKALGHPGNV